MAVPAAVTLRATINAGAPQSGPVAGGITVAASDVVQLSIANTAGVDKYLWEIIDFPDGFALPSGWSQSSGKRGYYNTDPVPPTFTIPSTSGLFGRWICKVTVNDGKRSTVNGYADAPELIDDSIGLNLPSATGLVDTPLGETNQFSTTLTGMIDALKANWRVIESAGLSGGAANPTGGANEGAGVGVFKNKTTAPDTLHFRTILDSADGKLTFSQGTDELTPAYDDTDLLLLDGTRPMTGDLDLDSNKVINVDTPTNGGDAANKTYVDNKFASVFSGLGAIAGAAVTALYLGDDAPASGAFSTWDERGGSGTDLTSSGNPQGSADWNSKRTAKLDGTGDYYSANSLATAHSGDWDHALTVLLPIHVDADTTVRTLISWSNSANDNTEKAIRLSATNKYLQFRIQNDAASSNATADDNVAFPEGERALLGLTFSGSNVTAFVKTESGYTTLLNNVAVSTVTGNFTVDRFTLGGLVGLSGLSQEVAAKVRGFALWNGHSVTAEVLKNLLEYFEYAIGADLEPAAAVAATGVPVEHAASLTSDVNNWDPDGSADTVIITPDTDGWYITGYAAPGEGDKHEVTFVNKSTDKTIIFPDSSGSSSASNIFINPTQAELRLDPEETVTYKYDSTNSAWRLKSHFTTKPLGNVVNVAISAQEDDHTPTSKHFNILRFTLTGGDLMLTGIASPDGSSRPDRFVIHNADTVDTLILPHEHTGSTFSSRFVCPGGVNFFIPPNGSVHVERSYSTNRWLVVSPAVGKLSVLPYRFEQLESDVVASTAYDFDFNLADTDLWGGTHEDNAVIHVIFHVAFFGDSGASYSKSSTVHATFVFRLGVLSNQSSYSDEFPELFTESTSVNGDNARLSITMGEFEGGRLGVAAEVTQIVVDA